MTREKTVTLDEIRCISVAPEEVIQFLVADPSEDAGIGDLVAVEVENGEDSAVSDRVQKFIGVPGSGQGAGLGLAIAHHAGGQKVGVVEHGAKGVGQGVAQLAALVDGAGRFRGHMAGDPAGEGELFEQAFHALLVLAHVGVDLAVRTVQPVLGHHGVAAVAGAGDIDHIQIIFLDGAVEMGIDKVLPGYGAPVTHNGALDMLGLEGFPEQRIVQKIELARRQVVGGSPPGIHLLQLVRGERPLFGHPGGGLSRTLKSGFFCLCHSNSSLKKKVPTLYRA